MLGLGVWLGLMVHVGLGLGLKVDDGRGWRKCVIDDSGFHSSHCAVLSLSPLMTRK